MSDERPTNQGELVLSSTGRLTTRSAGLVRRGLDSLLAEQERKEKLWSMYTDAANKAEKQGYYNDAERFFLAAIKEAEGFGPWDLRLAASLEDLAFMLYSGHGWVFRGWPDEAETLYLRACTIRERALGPEHPETVRTLDLLALCYNDQGKYAQAEPLFRRILASEEKELGPVHPNVVRGLELLAYCYYRQEKYAEAEVLYQHILARWDKIPGEDGVFRYVVHLKQLAWCYYRQEKYAEAEPLYHRVLQIYEKEWRREDLEVADILEKYAALLRSTDRNPEAEDLEAR